jgi:hypothetical protein
VLERELALGGVPGVGLAQDSVAVSGNDLSALEGRPDVLLDGFIRGVLANLGLHLAQPQEHLLVCEPVERPSETIERRREREEGIRESRADKFTGVRGDVAALFHVSSCGRRINMRPHLRDHCGW